MDTLGKRLELCVPVGARNTLGTDVIGRSLESVGDTDLTLGKLLELEIGAVGPAVAIGIGDIVGSELDGGSNVGGPSTSVEGIGDKLGR